MLETHPAKPTRTFKGTWPEVLSQHQAEIPNGATVELNIFEAKANETEEAIGDFGGRTLADLIREIGFVEGGPSDMATNPEYMKGFGQTKSIIRNPEA